MLDLLVFELEGHRFGLRLADVEEVVRAVLPVPLPRAPSIVEGLIDVRGVLVAVLDVRGRFGLPSRALAPDQHLVLARAWDAHGGERRVALRVDRVADLVRVEDVDPGELERAGPGSPHVAGVARLPDGLLLIHALSRFLSEAEADALDRALREREAPAAGKEAS